VPEVPEADGFRIKQGVTEDAFRAQVRVHEDAARAEAAAGFAGKITIAEHGDLAFEGTNEYGAFPKHTLNLYGYKHLLEPHKITTFKPVTSADDDDTSTSTTTYYHWTFRRLSVLNDDVDDVISSETIKTHIGDSFAVTAKGPNEW